VLFIVRHQLNRSSPKQDTLKDPILGQPHELAVVTAMGAESLNHVEMNELRNPSPFEVSTYSMFFYLLH